MDGMWLGQRWNDGMALLGKPGFSQMQIILFNVIGLLAGIVAIWVYAAIRPRFGAGIKTAVYRGVAAWILSTLLPNIGFMHVAHLFSNHLALYTTLGGLEKLFSARLSEHRSTRKANDFALCCIWRQRRQVAILRGSSRLTW